MTALKVLVACVSFVALGLLVAIPYKLDDTAGVVCLVATITGALGALSTSVRKDLDRVGRWAKRFMRRLYGRAVFMLLLLSPLFLRDVLPELAISLHLGLVCSLMTGWLSYKVVETLRGAPTAA